MHSTCLILAMLGVKAIRNIGYRETQRFFAERGYAKLPDFRTMQWRSSELKQNGVHIGIETKEGRNEYSIIVKPERKGAFINQKGVSTKSWNMHMRGLKSDFVELAL